MLPVFVNHLYQLLLCVGRNCCGQRLQMWLMPYQDKLVLRRFLPVRLFPNLSSGALDITVWSLSMMECVRKGSNGVMNTVWNWTMPVCKELKYLKALPLLFMGAMH